MREVRPGEIYRHFKGNLYQIVAVAKHSETREDYVVYQALYGDMGVWVRPYDMFVSEVDHAKYPEVTAKYRFELLNTLAGGGVAPVMNSAFGVGNSASTVPAGCTNNVGNPSGVLSNTTVDVAVDSEATSDDEGVVDERLLEFLDTDSIQAKIDYLTYNQKKIDDRLIDDIAAAMDLVVEQGPIDARFLSLKNCLLTKAKYEVGRRG